jgi:hypothetical protein
MDEPRTCVVLGAGASHPYWFPLGSDLKSVLCTSAFTHKGGKERHEVQIKGLFAQAGFTDDEITRFQDTLLHSPQETIDRFLELRPEFERIGKVGIAGLISFYESQCIYTKRRPGGNHLYQPLYHATFPNPPHPNKALHIVSFNYDQSLERFFVQGLIADAGLSAEEAWKVVAQLGIIHVHGCINKECVTWPMQGEQLFRAAQCIKVVHQSDLAGHADEDHADAAQKHIATMRHVIQHSTKIVFLGFGYDPKNVSLLDIRNDWPPQSMGRLMGHKSPPQKTVYGTCFRMREAAINKARLLFSVHSEIRANQNDMDAFTFIRETGVLDA